jgi:hypothetical protein
VVRVKGGEKVGGLSEGDIGRFKVGKRERLKDGKKRETQVWGKEGRV